ncbi:hypothetical protein [Lentibacillus jeotgali]|uniref:hypothetical protein n=1 Tax=Lentibacillus jeotgali TaxID=558169 RepID=UPI0002629368|nr:hypothetical protein [Lentibacillus jeotgali]
MKLVIRLLFAGIIAGTILEVMLKGIDVFTGKKVYALLLNVDYIPVMRKWQMTEVQAFLLHLGVSVVIVFGLYFLLKRTRKMVLWFALTTFLIGGFYFPLRPYQGGRLM